MKFAYPANLSQTAPNETAVSFRDLPACLTSRTNVQEALSAAADALEDALAERIDDGDPILQPSAMSDAKRAAVKRYEPTSTGTGSRQSLKRRKFRTASFVRLPDRSQLGAVS